MYSKKESLRQGLAVKFKNGLSGQLNKENQELELSDGRSLPLSDRDKRDLFPSSPHELKVAQKREVMSKNAGKSFGGEFLHQFLGQGIAGGALDIADKLILSGDDYIAKRQAKQELSEDISERSPWTSGVATAASFVPDIALTGGMSAARAAPLLTAASSGSKLFTNPLEVAGEAGIAAIGGKFIDKVTSGLSKVASRRGEIRELPGRQQAVREANELGAQEVAGRNAAQETQYNILKRDVKNKNEQTLKQYEGLVEDRKNRMIDAENAYQQAIGDRKSEFAKWQNAQKEYKESLSKIPELQKQAQKEYSENVVRNAATIEREFPKNSRISTRELDIDGYLSEFASSPQFAKTKKVLNGIFPSEVSVGGKELSKKYHMLEDAIQRSSGETREVLVGLKDHIGQKLPGILEDTIYYEKISPLLRKTIVNDVRFAIDKMPFEGDVGDQVKKSALKYATDRAKQIIEKEIQQGSFAQKVKQGEFGREIAQKIMQTEGFLQYLTPKAAKLANTPGGPKLFEKIKQEAMDRQRQFAEILGDQIENRLSKYRINSAASAEEKIGRMGKRVEGLGGEAEKIMPGEAPRMPGFEHIQKPSELPHPQKPNLMQEPVRGPQEMFNPEQIPTLPPAQGMAGRSGDFLEKNIFGGKTLVNNPLTKLAGLKYALGKGALPLEAAYLGAKGLTSPTQAGAMARQSFSTGGVESLRMMAEQYPSYRNGILESPQDRRSLNKEIEDDQEIPIEQKAVIQSKINRGKPF